jgi:hypothetical protein
MKKSVYLFSISLFLLAVATGCSDRGEEPELNILELESANVSFGPYGGSGEIIVKSTAGGVTASSAATWCTATASGNKVTVTVPSYGELLGRATVVMLVSGGKKVQVPVMQSGLELKVESKAVEIPAIASDTTVQVSCPVPVTAQSSADWLIINVTADNVLELHAIANDDSFAPRTATVTLTGGDLAATITVTQKGATAFLAFNDYLGTWTLSHANNFSETGNRYNKTALVTDSGTEDALLVTLKNGNSTLFTFTMNYDAATGKVNIPFQEVVRSGSYLVALVTVTAGAYIHTDGGLDGIATGGTYANPVLTFTDDGTGGSASPYVGFVTWLFNATTGASHSQYTGFGTNSSVFTFITMEKQ